MACICPSTAQDYVERRASKGDGRQAQHEAGRCLSCGNCYECDNCFAACPEDAIVKLGPGRGYEITMTRCTGCAICFDRCPCHAIEMVPEPAVESGP